jgi:hypothetical protein
MVMPNSCRPNFARRPRAGESNAYDVGLGEGLPITKGCSSRDHMASAWSRIAENVEEEVLYSSSACLRQGHCAKLQPSSTVRHPSADTYWTHRLTSRGVSRPFIGTSRWDSTLRTRCHFAV